MYLLVFIARHYKHRVLISAFQIVKEQNFIKKLNRNNQDDYFYLISKWLSKQFV